jgi:AGZA family xanthine/uracil permease-like MFS transporter
MLLCAMTIALIDRRLATAAAWAGAGGALSWVGLMHADKLGWGAAPQAAAGYALMAVAFLVVARLAPMPPEAAPGTPHDRAAIGQPGEA